eukprot:scaffold480089_cov42-Prasinocladus_malaysianus.AAC.1
MDHHRPSLPGVILAEDLPIRQQGKKSSVEVWEQSLKVSAGNYSRTSGGRRRSQHQPSDGMRDDNRSPYLAAQASAPPFDSGAQGSLYPSPTNFVHQPIPADRTRSNVRANAMPASGDSPADEAHPPGNMLVSMSKFKVWSKLAAYE